MASSPTLADRGFEKRSWTSDEDRLLVRLVLKGWRADAICAEFRMLGRAPAQVTARVDFLMFAGSSSLPGLERALFVLMGTARADKSCAGGFRLRGAQVRAIDVVAAANRVLKIFNHPPIAYPGLDKKRVAA